MAAAVGGARAAERKAVCMKQAKHRANPIDRTAAPGEARNIETRSEE